MYVIMSMRRCFEVGRQSYLGSLAACFPWKIVDSEINSGALWASFHCIQEYSRTMQMEKIVDVHTGLRGRNCPNHVAWASTYVRLETRAIGCASPNQYTMPHHKHNSKLFTLNQSSLVYIVEGGSGQGCLPDIFFTMACSMSFSSYTYYTHQRQHEDIGVAPGCHKKTCEYVCVWERERSSERERERDRVFIYWNGA